MTESRDQRFFDALNNSGRDEDGDAQADAPNSAAAGEVPPLAAPVYPPRGFAADAQQDDPAGGRHHVDPPSEVGGAWGQPVGGAWGEPARQADPSPQPWQPAGGSDKEAPAAPEDRDVQPSEAAPQRFSPSINEPTGPAQSIPPAPPSTDRGRETPGPAWPQRPTADPGAAAVPPPPPGREPLFGGPAPVSAGTNPQDTPAARPAPRPVPPEERTQFLSREALREALPRNNAPQGPPPGWPAQGSPSRPGGQQPAPPPGWAPRGPEQPQAEPSGPRPPEWNWSQTGGVSGGAELRSEQISASELNVPRKIPSSRGWRKWLYYGTFKLINTGESPDEQLLRNLNATVAGHLRGTYSIVVLGGKGGVGKTTTTASVGSTFASLRKDKTIAIDSNPDRASNLADRIDPSATDSYKDVLSDPNLQRYTDIRSHVGMNSSGLDVLGNRYQSDRQPLTAQIYIDTHAQLQRFYSVLISDSGTDVDHPVIPGLMDRADALIMVASTAPDGAKGAAELMDWAYEAGYHRLLQRTVVVINDVRGEGGRSHRKLVDSLVEKFSRWVSPQRVFVVPFDPHIASAGVIDINELRPETRRRYLEITARVAGGFNSSEDRQ
jgi:MinD-like ATPase involved in chromosome partitioning or flagellar assembly